METVMNVMYSYTKQKGNKCVVL